MRKDEIKASDVCPDCANDESNTEPGPNETDDCCSCCCSCSDTESESGSSREPMASSKLLLSIEQQKKDLLSNLTILQTNRERTSIQHVLQFIEALTHSDDFLRRYNLQEDFCLQCLISEPTCTCCANGISQLSINDNTHCSCDECDRSDESRHQTRSSQECTDCIASAKAPVSTRQISSGRRDRRRRRRRQRNIRHNLPRVSSQSFTETNIPPNQNRNSSSTNANCFQCKENGNNSTNSEEYLAACPECNDDAKNAPDSKERLAYSHHDSCEECGHVEASGYKGRFKSNEHPNSYHGNARDDSDCSEECARRNLFSPSSSSFLSCRNLGNSRRRRRNLSRGDSRQRENAPALACTCCSSLNPFDQRDSSLQNGQLKRMKASEKPECDQEDASTSSESGKNHSTECSCESCRMTSACSEESCDECETRHSKKSKNWKKK